MTPNVMKAANYHLKTSEKSGETEEILKVIKKLTLHNSLSNEAKRSSALKKAVKFG